MTDPAPRPSQDEPRWHGRVAVMAITILTLVAMGRLCVNNFTWWDDQGTIHQNAWLQPPTLRTIQHYFLLPAFGLYIPVTYCVWAILAAIAHVKKDQYGIALNPWVFHSASVLFHLLATLMAYRILRLLNADIFGAACGALLFAVHPIQVESVAWASGLKDVLSGFLALLAILQYVRFCISDMEGKASITRFLLATLTFLLAMLAKPSVVALPLAAIAIDRWVIGRNWKRIAPAALGWVAMATPLAIVARWAQEASNTVLPPLFLRPLIVLDSLAFYLWKLLWPTDLIVDYGRNPATVISHGWCYWDWIFPAAIGVFLVLGIRRRPVLLAAALIFIAGCLPVLGFTPALFQFFSTVTDHYLYFSLFGPALALAWLLSIYPSIILRSIAGGWLIVLILLTINQGGYWRNDIALFTHDTLVNTGSYVGFINLGGAYERDHDSANAIVAFRNATIANPDYALAFGDLADALEEAGQHDEALAAAQRSVELQTLHPNLRPSWEEDNAMLGQLLLRKGKFVEAITYLQTALDQNPQNKSVEDDLAQAKAKAATQPGR